MASNGLIKEVAKLAKDGTVLALLALAVFLGAVGDSLSWCSRKLEEALARWQRTGL